METMKLRDLRPEEKTALAVLDEQGMDAAVRESGLTNTQIVHANNLRFAHNRTNGGVAVAPAAAEQQGGAVLAAGADPVGPVDAVPEASAETDPDPVDRAGQLVGRAREIGGRRALFLAARIISDLHDLVETLEEDERTYAARQRRDDLLSLRARVNEDLAKAEAALRAANGLPRKTAAKPAAKKTAKAPARKTAAKSRRSGDATGNSAYYSAAVRKWAKEHGLEVSDHGRMTNDVIAAYLAAHADAQPADSGPVAGS